MKIKNTLVMGFLICICFFLVLGCKAKAKVENNPKESMLLYHPQFKNLINSNHVSIQVFNTKGEKVGDYPTTVSTAIDQEIAALVKEFGHLEGNKAVRDEIRFKALNRVNSGNLSPDFPMNPAKMAVAVDGVDLLAIRSSKYTENRGYRYTVVLVFP